MHEGKGEEIGKLGFDESWGEGEGAQEQERSVCPPPLEFRNSVFCFGSPLRHISSHKYILRTSAPRVSSFRDRVKKLGCIIRIPGKGGGGGGIRFHPCRGILPSIVHRSLFARRISSSPRQHGSPSSTRLGIFMVLLGEAWIAKPRYVLQVIGEFASWVASRLPRGCLHPFFSSPHPLPASMRFLLLLLLFLSLSFSIFSPFSLQRILMELPVATFRASVFLARLLRKTTGEK